MMLTLLHTSPIHVATFDSLRDTIAPNAALTHIVREDLLDRARTEGLSDQILAEITALITGANGPVLCTCTTLGEIAEQAGAIRIDRPLMQAAADTGGPIMLAYCLESTAQPSLSLLQQEMKVAGNANPIDPLFIAAAWPFFEAEDTVRFASEIASVIRAHLDSKITCIVLAQASMAGATAPLAGLGIPVLSSPELAVRFALKRA